MKYETGEQPTVGDVVQGFPNNVNGVTLAGIVYSHHEGLLCVVMLHRSGDPDRFYGNADRFKLIARNPC